MGAVGGWQQALHPAAVSQRGAAAGAAGAVGHGGPWQGPAARTAAPPLASLLCGSDRRRAAAETQCAAFCAARSFALSPGNQPQGVNQYGHPSHF